jgi:hypothetical protein
VGLYLHSATCTHTENRSKLIVALLKTDSDENVYSRVPVSTDSVYAVYRGPEKK